MMLTEQKAEVNCEVSAAPWHLQYLVILSFICTKDSNSKHIVV